MTEPAPKPSGVIIAGGGSARFGGGDKFLSPLGQETVLDHVIRRARPQVSSLLLNVNDDVSRVRNFGIKVICDDGLVSQKGTVGPLGGILAALKYAENKGEDFLLTFASDTPFMPKDFAEKLCHAQRDGGREIVIACSDGRPHPVMALWSVALRGALEAYLLSGERRVMAFVQQQTYDEVSWAETRPDPFFNINHREDLQRAELYLKNTASLLK